MAVVYPTPQDAEHWDASLLAQDANLLAPDVPSKMVTTSRIARIHPLGQLVLSQLKRLTFEPITNSSASSPAAGLAALLEMRARGEQVQTPLSQPGLVWQPIASTPLSAIDDAYQSLLFARLGDLLGPASTTTTVRRRLGYLLFHPLQNIAQHAGGRGVFGGLAMRLTEAPAPRTPSLDSYLAFLAATNGTPRRFLECIVHDDGVGIAEHYARARMAQEHGIADYRAMAQEPTSEWIFLKAAFERHTSSKFFRDTIDQPAGSDADRPGIGLAAMITAARSLNAYMDVRTGRFRAFRWFRPDERMTKDNLIHPDTPPSPSAPIRGTILRMLVPLPETVGN